MLLKPNFVCQKRPILKISEFGVRKSLLIKKEPAKET